MRRCLDEDHFGLEKVKKRIVEYVAIRKLRTDKKGPILLLHRPARRRQDLARASRSRARWGAATSRIALGGVRDEAEIRGHRRTYVGALPGRIIQALKKVGTKNPVLVLDEIDKMGVDMRGDPAAALLEVLDPEQNVTFQDHYIDCPSTSRRSRSWPPRTTATRIPPAALRPHGGHRGAAATRATRSSASRASSWCPKQLSAHGLTDERLEFAEPGIETLIDHYTREAGVRDLEREIASVCRHVAVRSPRAKTCTKWSTPELVENVLGPHKHRPEIAERKGAPGVATGLAWTPCGRRRSSSSRRRKMPGKGEHHRSPATCAT